MVHGREIQRADGSWFVFAILVAAEAAVVAGKVEDNVIGRRGRGGWDVAAASAPLVLWYTVSVSSWISALPRVQSDGGQITESHVNIVTKHFFLPFHPPPPPSPPLPKQRSAPPPPFHGEL